MLLFILYDIVLWIGALFAFPKMLYLRLVKGKYRDAFLKRLGKGFPSIEKGSRKLIWVHAVSVGETKAVAALIKKIKEDMRDCLIVFSSVTETGHAEAKRSLPFVDYHVYLPFDFWWLIYPIVNRTKPDVVIISETDLWFNFLRSCKEKGAFIAIVNGKLSERSQRTYKKLPWFSKKLFSFIDLFCVQAPIYQQRLESVGVNNKRIVVTGNMKFDEELGKLSDGTLANLKQKFNISSQNQVIVIGSSHDSEEKQFLEVLIPVWKKFPELIVILVPRHPERFNHVAALLKENGISFVRYSEIDKKSGKEKMILIDAMGLLRDCYQLADIALIAGSYTDKVGGHNILEPCFFGVPLLFGPYMFKQPELVELVSEYQAGLQVPIEQLELTIIELLQDQSKRSRLGNNGLRLINEMRGATGKTWNSIKSTFSFLKGALDM